MIEKAKTKLSSFAKMLLQLVPEKHFKAWMAIITARKVGPQLAASPAQLNDYIAELTSTGVTANQEQLSNTLKIVGDVYHSNKEAQQRGINLQAGDARLRMSPMELEWLYGKVQPETTAPQAAGDVESINGPRLQLRPGGLDQFSWMQERRQLETLLGKQKIQFYTPPQLEAWRRVLDEMYTKFNSPEYDMARSLELQAQGASVSMSPGMLTFLYGNITLTGAGPQGSYYVNLGGTPWGDPQGTRNDLLAIYEGDLVGNIKERLNDNFEKLVADNTNQINTEKEFREQLANDLKPRPSFTPRPEITPKP